MFLFIIILLKLVYNFPLLRENYQFHLNNNNNNNRNTEERT